LAQRPNLSRPAHAGGAATPMATGWSVCSGHEPWRPDRQNDASTVATSKRWVLDVGVEGGGGSDDSHDEGSRRVPP
jgi:hypothetical protein